MFLLFIFLICIFVALGAGAMASLSDIRGLTIPNLYSAVVIGSFVVAYIVLWLFGRDDVFFSLLSHFLGALLVFGVTAGMFALGGIGAADSKLATAYALWAGLSGLGGFLLYTTIGGGILAVMALAMKKWKPFKNPPAGSWPARVQAGESKVPYGVAIVFGALASFVNLGYLGGAVLSSFLLS